jgi:hypothetical protein
MKAYLSNCNNKSMSLLATAVVVAIFAGCGAESASSDEASVVQASKSTSPSKGDFVSRYTEDCDDGVDNDHDLLVDADDPSCADSPDVWTATALWHGFYNRYANESCSASPAKYFNRHSSGSYSSEVGGDIGSPEDGALSLVVRSTSEFGQNIDLGPTTTASEQRVYYSGVAFNQHYMRSMTGGTGVYYSDEFGAGETTVRHDLGEFSDWDLQNRKAFVVLTRYSVSTLNSDASVYDTQPMGLRTHKVKASLVGDGIFCPERLDEECYLNVKIDSHFDIDTPEAETTLLAYFSYEVFIYDPDYVSVQELGTSEEWTKSSGDLASTHRASQVATFTESWAGDVSEDNIFVGLSATGWNTTDANYSDVITGLSHHVALGGWNAATKEATVVGAGNGYRKFCGPSSTFSLPPNAQNAVVVICRDSTVCKGTATQYRDVSVDAGDDGAVLDMDTLTFTGLDYADAGDAGYELPGDDLPRL